MKYCETCRELFGWSDAIDLTEGKCQICGIVGPVNDTKLMLNPHLPQVIQLFGDEYDFLSNFYKIAVPFEGMLWPTSEHSFQGVKTLDEGQRRLICHAATPGKAKRLGRTVELREDWENIKFNMMLRILMSKFRFGTDISNKLLATGDAVLVEGNNWHDNIWGHCFCEKCRTEVGMNGLGKLLMVVRNQLQTLETLHRGNHVLLQ